jgi:glyoxylase I family protein
MNPRFDRVTIVFNVKDLDRTERFYSEHLGFKFEHGQDEYGGTAFLSTKVGNDVELLVFPGDPRPGNTPGVVFSLGDGGIDTLVENLAAKGIEIVTPVSEAPGGWYSDFRDPDGQVISLFQAGELPKTLG